MKSDKKQAGENCVVMLKAAEKFLFAYRESNDRTLEHHNYFPFQRLPDERKTFAGEGKADYKIIISRILQFQSTPF